MPCPLAAFILMLLEAYWYRYFKSGRAMADFYGSFPGVPASGAALPAWAFFLFALYGKNIFLGAAVEVPGIGHIGIHPGRQREIR